MDRYKCNLAFQQSNKQKHFAEKWLDVALGHGVSDQILWLWKFDSDDQEFGKEVD